MADATPILGIDFGTCQCSVAWFNPKSNHAELLRNAEGYEKTPSVVFYDKGTGDVLVGNAAELMLDEDESSMDVKVGVKHDIGKDILIHLGGKDRRPVDIAADIFRKLKRDAEQLHFKAPVTAAVVTHPAAFDPTEKERLAEAATLAGFERVMLLSEPEAAAIAVTRAGIKVGNNLVVYDLGAGTFDLTLLLQTGDGNYRLPIGSRGKRFGGDDFDRALYEHCDAIARQQYGRGFATDGQVDPQFMRACRQRKENLSLRDRADFSSVLKGDQPAVFKHRIERGTFENLIRSVVESTVRATTDLVDEAERSGYKPDSILLIGGSSRIPMIAAQLKAALPIEPVQWQQQDVAVALGAAIYGDTKLSLEAGRGGTSGSDGKTSKPPADPPLVTDLNLKLHRAVIDTKAKNVFVHAETIVGLSDGSSRSGIPVAFFINGQHYAERHTDDFGRATLREGISPDLLKVRAPNELKACVKGSAKASMESFAILSHSPLFLSAVYDSKREETRERTRYTARYNTENIAVEVVFASQDFSDVSDTLVRLDVVGQSKPFSETMPTNREGMCRFRIENEWTYISYYDSDDGQSGPEDRELDSVKIIHLHLVGFPECFSISTKVKK